MSKDILIISRETGFMMNALTKNLAANGFEARHIDPSDLVSSPDGHIDGGNPRLILLYTGDYTKGEEGSRLLSILRDVCENGKRTLFIAGSREEISGVKQEIPPHIVSCEAERPFTVPGIIEQIKKILKKDDINAGGRKSILLVDDDVMFLKMTMKWLSEHYDVALAKSGGQALAYLESKCPDLVMLDYNMPVMSGAQVMQQIRSSSPHSDVPIIFLTGKSDKESVAEVMALKPQGYIFKASAQADILNTINDFFKKQSLDSNMSND